MKKLTNMGTQNTSFRNTDLSLKKKIDKNVNISGIKKNFSYDINDSLRKIDQSEIDYSDPQEIKKRVRKLSQDILDSNRMHLKMSKSRKKTDIDNVLLDNIDLSSVMSQQDENGQKVIKLNTSIKSGNHKDFLVKVNMIGDLNSGKSSFVNIITESKPHSKNKNEAKKGIKGVNSILSKKEYLYKIFFLILIKVK